MNEFHFFWGGPFSQWHPSQFEVGGVKYNCTEQYMMSKKAELFVDRKAQLKIMAYSDPRMQKAIGKKPIVLFGGNPLLGLAGRMVGIGFNMN